MLLDCFLLPGTFSQVASGTMNSPDLTPPLVVVSLLSSSLISLDAGACQQFLFVYFSLFFFFFSFLLFSHPNTQMQPTGFHTMTSRMKCVPLPIDQDQHEVRTSDLGIVYETYLLAESG